MTTEAKMRHTLGAECAFKTLVHLFPESSLRNFPDSVKTIIDNSTNAPEILELLREFIGYIPCTCPWPKQSPQHVAQCDAGRLSRLLSLVGG